MSTTLVVVVAAVVILITALMVTIVFTGGLENFLRIFNPWSEDTAKNALCQSKCTSDCLTYGGNLPQGHTVTIKYDDDKDGKEEDYPCVIDCKCL